MEGRLQTRKWQDKAGVDHYTTEVLANEMQMLDSRNANSGGEHAQAGNAPAGNAQRNAPQAAAAAAPAASSQPADFGDFDDDIPF